jgi:hypothetical protein
MQPVLAPPSIPTGNIKSFGALGPKYQVGRLLHPMQDGDWMVEVKMLETGETTQYRWSRLREDPEAH